MVLRGTLSTMRLLRGGALLGIGIITMHYTGMAAMHIEPRLHYQPLLVGVSCLLAIAGAVVACWSALTSPGIRLQHLRRGETPARPFMAAVLRAFQVAAPAVVPGSEARP